MARLPRISKPRIPKPLTSPSAAYGLPQATGSPSGFYGGGQAAPPVGGAPAFGSTGAGMGAGLGAGSGSTGSTLPRIGGTLGGVPMVRTQQQPDPYAALSDAELRSRTLAQISATYDPLIAQITSSYEQRAAAGGQAIKGITDQLVQQMRGYQGSAANIYGQAQQSQAASDAALSSMLSGQGTQLASELGSRLASINAPAATQGAQQAVTQAGTGSAGALYGKGSASQSDLIARGAGAQEYAAKLPGIAGLAGLQQLGQFQGQISGAEQDELGRLRSQIPGATADLLSSLRTTEMQKADRQYQAGRDVIGDQRYATEQARLAAATKASQASSAASLAERRREFGITQAGKIAATNATNRTRVDIANARAKNAAAPKPFKLSPNQTEYMPDGKGGYTQFTAPPVPKGVTAEKPPKTISTPAGTMQWDPTSHKWSTIAGTQPPPKPASVPNTIKTLGVSVSTGGWNPKTNALSPQVRAGIKGLTGIDPGPTATRAQLTAAGLLPKAAAPKTRNVDQKLSQALGYWADSTGARIASVPGKPTPIPGLKQKINIGLSRYAGHWVDAYGDQVKGVTGTPPPPDQATPKLDFTRSRAEHKWVDSDGNPVSGIPGRPPPLRTPNTGTAGERARWEATAHSFAAGAFNGGKDKDGNDLPPLTYTQALDEAQKEPVPFAVMAKELAKVYAHGNKEVQTFLNDSGLTFTVTGDGSVAALKNGRLVRTFRRGNPGYNTARQRALARR